MTEYASPAVRVLMVVANPCTNDSRVIREAEALAAGGYRVRVICKQQGSVPEQESRRGVEYVRVPMLPTLPLLGAIRRVIYALSPTVSGDNGAIAKAPSQVRATLVPRWALRRIRDALYGTLYRTIRSAPLIITPLQAFTRSFNAVVDEARRYRPQIVHVHDLAPLLAVLEAAAELKAKVVYDSHELESHRVGLTVLGRLSSGYVEAKAIKKVDRVITVCDSISDFLASRYGIERPLVVLNTPDLANVSPGEGTIRDRLGIARSVPLAVFVGGIRSGRGLEQFVRALPYCKDFHAALLGPRTEDTVRVLLALAKDLGVAHRFHLVESVAPGQVVPFISSADVGVVPIQDVCLSYRYCFPNKLFELTFAGIPVCVSDLPELRSFVGAEGVGLTMNEKDPKDIARAMCEVHRRRSEFIATGERLRSLKAKYAWEVQAKKLVDLYASILDKRADSRDLHMVERRTICHITTVHPLGDTRIFYREAAAVNAEAKYSLVLIASVGSGGVPAEFPGEIRFLPAPGGRLRRMLLSQFRAIRLALSCRADLYHLHDPELLLGAILLRSLGKRVVFDVHEDLPKQMCIKPWIPRPIVGIGVWFARLFDALVPKCSDGIVAATPEIGRKYRGTQVAVVQNFPILEELVDRASPPLAKRGNLAVYLGTITEERGLRCMLQAAECTAERLNGNFRLKLAGRFVSEKDRKLFEACANKDIVEYVGWQDRRQAAELLGQAVVGLVTLLPTASYLESYPVKLFEYGAAAIPAIASDFPLWRQMMGDCCVFVDPTAPEAIGDALYDLMTDKAKAEAIGRKAQALVRDRYSWEAEAKKLLALYEQLLTPRSRADRRTGSSRHRAPAR